MEALDYFGREIKVGDTIAYPGRHASSGHMNHGVVVRVWEYEPYCYGRQRMDRPPTIPQITVQKLGISVYKKVMTPIKTRKVTIRHLNRCIILARNAEPAIQANINI